jgi:hypothetical protein
MSVKESPINAKVVFNDGNVRHWAGNRFEKENCNVMVALLRTAILKKWFHVKEVKIYDNRKENPKERLIFHATKDAGGSITFVNDLKNYLGENYNPPSLKQSSSNNQRK